MGRNRDLSPHQRAFLIGYLLGQGCRLRTIEVARLTGLTDGGALYLMHNGAGVVPLVFRWGVWEVMNDDEREGEGK